MADLKTCLGIHNAPKEVQDIIHAKRKELEAEGMLPEDATSAALSYSWNVLDKGLSDVKSQMSKIALETMPTKDDTDILVSNHEEAIKELASKKPVLDLRGSAESVIAKVKAYTKDKLTEQEIIQAIGSVEQKYKAMELMQTQGIKDIEGMFKQFGLNSPSIPKNKEWESMTLDERLQTISRLELLQKLEDKKNDIRERRISKEKEIETHEEMLSKMAYTKGNSYFESLMNDIRGFTNGKGDSQSFMAKEMGLQHEVINDLGVFIDKNFNTPFGYKLPKGFEKKIVDEMYGKDSGDSIARQFAKIIKDTNQKGADMLVSRGMRKNLMKGYDVQHKWDSELISFFGLDKTQRLKAIFSKDQSRILKESKKRWVDKMMTLVDRQHRHYIDKNTGEYFSDGKMTKFLEESWDTLASNGANKSVRRENGELNTGLESRLNYERQLHFKDGESWYEMNQLAGSSNFLDLVVGQYTQLSKDLAILEKFGPRPTTVINKLIAKGAEIDSKTNIKWESKKNSFEALITGVFGTRGDVSFMGNKISNALGIHRQFLVATRLGSALLSQVGDIPVFEAWAAKHDMGIMQGSMKALKMLNPANVKDRQAAREMGFAIRNLADDLSNRVLDGMNKQGFTAKYANTVITGGGMKYWSEAMDMAAKNLIMYSMNQNKGKDFAKLGAGFRQMLSRHGINEAEWNVIRSAKETDFNGEAILHPVSMDQKHAELVWGMVERESSVAVLRPDEATRSTFIRGDKGSVGYEFMASMMLFRSFTSAFVQRFIPMITTKYEGETTGAYARTLAGTVTALMVANAMTVQMKEIANGREPRDMTDPKFWVKAAFQGVGLGYFGEYLFGDKSQRTGEMIASIIGPQVQHIAEMGKLAKDGWRSLKGEDVKFDDQAIAFARKNSLPNFWYTKTLLNHYLWYPLMEATNPGSVYRMQKRIERETGNKYFLEPTEALR